MMLRSLDVRTFASEYPMKHDPHQRRPSSEPRPRMRYEKPAVISDEVFETLALSCAQANEAVCPGGNPNRS